MIIGGGEMFSLPHAVGVVIARLSFMITYIFLCKRVLSFTSESLFYHNGLL